MRSYRAEDALNGTAPFIIEFSDDLDEEALMRRPKDRLAFDLDKVRIFPEISTPRTESTD